MEDIYIGKKEISQYITACFYALNENKEIKIVARGSYIKKAIDIVAILIRDYLENPGYSVSINSEPFEERNVSSIEIVLSGIRKSKK